MSGEWLSLSEIAEILGVHPSTVRSWSDQGRIPVHRTQGGHRRYRRSEVELWMHSRQVKAPHESQVVIQNALKRIRIQIGKGRLESETWYEKLDDEARDKYRRSGRALMQGLSGYLASSSDVSDADARSLGYEYASRGWRHDLSSAEATQAFLFFRNVLLDSMFAVFEAAAVQSPQAWSDMFKKINKFTDQIQITLLETYDAYQRGSK
jgi:excisionase family DNA binding protein